MLSARNNSLFETVNNMSTKCSNSNLYATPKTYNRSELFCYDELTDDDIDKLTGTHRCPLILIYRYHHDTLHVSK